MQYKSVIFESMPAIQYNTFASENEYVFQNKSMPESVHTHDLMQSLSLK